MLKLKLQSFGCLTRRADSLEKTLMLGKIEGRKRKGQQRVSWLDGIIDSKDMNLTPPLPRTHQTHLWAPGEETWVLTGHAMPLPGPIPSPSPTG